VTVEVFNHFVSIALILFLLFLFSIVLKDVNGDDTVSLIKLVYMRPILLITG
jgi:hypothetical protein